MPDPIDRRPRPAVDPKVINWVVMDNFLEDVDIVVPAPVPIRNKAPLPVESDGILL